MPGISCAPQVFPWGALINDLERPVFEKYVLLAALKRWLIERTEVQAALLAGSGSTTFALLAPGADASALADATRAEFGETMWCCATRVAGSAGA